MGLLCGAAAVSVGEEDVRTLCGVQEAQQITIYKTAIKNTAFFAIYIISLNKRLSMSRRVLFSTGIILSL